MEKLNAFLANKASRSSGERSRLEGTMRLIDGIIAIAVNGWCVLCQPGYGASSRDLVHESTLQQHRRLTVLLNTVACPKPRSRKCCSDTILAFCCRARDNCATPSPDLAWSLLQTKNLLPTLLQEVNRTKNVASSICDAIISTAPTSPSRMPFAQSPGHGWPADSFFSLLSDLFLVDPSSSARFAIRASLLESLPFRLDKESTAPMLAAQCRVLLEASQHIIRLVEPAKFKALQTALCRPPKDNPQSIYDMTLSFAKAKQRAFSVLEHAGWGDTCGPPAFVGGQTSAGRLEFRSRIQSALKSLPELYPWDKRSGDFARTNVWDAVVFLELFALIVARLHARAGSDRFSPEVPLMAASLSLTGHPLGVLSITEALSPVNGAPRRVMMIQPLLNTTLPIAQQNSSIKKMLPLCLSTALSSSCLDELLHTSRVPKIDQVQDRLLLMRLCVKISGEGAYIKARDLGDHPISSHVHLQAAIGSLMRTHMTWRYKFV